MQKAARPGQAEHQHRQVAGLDFPLLHKVIAEQAGVVGKLVPLIPFLDVGLDDFNPGDGLRQPGVHRPELLAPGNADRLEPPVVIGHRDG